MSSLAEIEKEIAAENEKDVVYETKKMTIHTHIFEERLVFHDQTDVIMDEGLQYVLKVQASSATKLKEASIGVSVERIVCSLLHLDPTPYFEGKVRLFHP